MGTDQRRRIPIARPSIGEAEWQALREPLLSGWLTQGPKVAEFEHTFAERHGVEFAIATTSCTTALHLALTAMSIGPGDEVIVPAFSWIATANVVLYCGASPIFVDIERDTYNIAPSAVEAAITPRTKAIIPVHLFGRCADMDAIQTSAPDVPIVEDAACAAGADYRGRPAGSLGRAGCFSFHPRKAITTGEGGMVTTDDAAFAEKVSILRNHGASVPEEVRHHGPKPYLLPDFKVLGFNYRMTDLQGAVGVVQLSKLDRLISERQHWAKFYTDELGCVDWLSTPSVPRASTHGWQSYVCYVDESRAPMTRDDLLELLEQRGVSARPGTHAIHVLDYYRERLGLKPGDFPEAAACHRSTIALPLHSEMSEHDYRYVVDVVLSTQ